MKITDEREREKKQRQKNKGMSQAIAKVLKLNYFVVC